MRKTLTVLGLVAASLMVLTNDASAQRRGGGGGRGGYSGSAYHGGNYYHSGYNGNYHNGYYHNNAYPYVALGVGLARGFGYGYGGYYGSGYGYYPYSDYYYSDYSYPGYYAQPAYPATAYYASGTQQSYYSDPNVATINVMLPDANAQIWFDDSLTRQQGMQRTYHTPPLQAGGTYTIKARFNNGGQVVDQQRVVNVQPGQSVNVDFRGEQLVTPRPGQPAPSAQPNPVPPAKGPDRP